MYLNAQPDFAAGNGFDAADGWQEAEAQGFLGDDFADFSRYIIQKMLVEALSQTTYHKHLADKVQRCHRRFRHRRCDRGHRWVVPAKYQIHSCGVRLCPHCSHRKGQEQALKIQKFCSSRPDSHFRYIVFAERNSKHLAKGIKSLYKAWNSLRRSVRWKKKVKGCICVLEVTYNHEAKTWHPHLNVLFEGEYFPFEELRQCWVKATNGRGQTAHITDANHGTAFELIKYTLKVANLEELPGSKSDNTPVRKVFTLLSDNPAVFDEFLSVIYGCRRIRTYGTFREISVEDEESETEKESDEEQERCPDCGSTHCYDLGPVHPRQQLKFDFEKKVLRALGDSIPLPVFNDAPKESTVEQRALARDIAHRSRRYERTVAKKFAA